MRAIYRSSEANSMDPYEGSVGTAYPDEEPDTWAFFPDQAKADDPQGIGFYVSPNELREV